MELPYEAGIYPTFDGRLVTDATEPRKPVLSYDGESIEGLEPRAAQFFTLHAAQVDKMLTCKAAALALRAQETHNAVDYCKNLDRRLRLALPEEIANSRSGALWNVRAVGNVAVSSQDETRVGFHNAGNLVDEAVDGRLMIDFDLWMVKADNQLIRSITLTEFKILAAFAANRPQVMLARDLTRVVWGTASYALEDSLRVHIKNIRNKLGRADGQLGSKTSGAIRNASPQGYYMAP